MEQVSVSSTFSSVSAQWEQEAYCAIRNVYDDFYLEHPVSVCFLSFFPHSLFQYSLISLRNLMKQQTK